MEEIGLKAKADECRLLASGARGARRGKLLSLADEYEAIHDALLRVKAEQKCIGGDEPTTLIAPH